MRLLEYESKELFSKFGIPLVRNIVILKGENIEEKVKRFSFPAIIKSQIAIGSRKKAGLIKIAQSEVEAIRLCKEYFNSVVAGFNVEAILIEELADIKHEYYASIALDASGRQFFIIASKEGGIDIEEVSKNNPEAIIKKSFTYKEGLTEKLALKVANQLGFSNTYSDLARDIFLKLWKITKDLEAELVEINPLVLTPSGLIAVDG
ncbi:MAG: ATP-grasp domain-containing protein, partial [Candidatus Heimdallarchaeota archaeon]